ncbi:hypothetical protein Anapl_16476 [Anas platyrhynchos]|uniref:Uncharacterized protein n=1 Tax=Anas platyrhynchos TaxID=8839 RepID=R0KQJ2_ANAPL|nr:hypothetical protein Anapl_16476 [Anas platyrhynchos]
MERQVFRRRAWLITSITTCLLKMLRLASLWRGVYSSDFLISLTKRMKFIRWERSTELGKGKKFLQLLWVVLLTALCSPPCHHGLPDGTGEGVGTGYTDTSSDCWETCSNRMRECSCNEADNCAKLNSSNFFLIKWLDMRVMTTIHLILGRHSPESWCPRVTALSPSAGCDGLAECLGDGHLGTDVLLRLENNLLWVVVGTGQQRDRNFGVPGEEQDHANSPILNSLPKTTPARDIFSDVPNDKWMSVFLKDEALEEFVPPDAGQFGNPTPLAKVMAIYQHPRGAFLWQGYYELLVLQEVSQQGPHAEGEHLVCHLIRTSQVFEDELFIKDASLDSGVAGVSQQLSGSRFCLPSLQEEDTDQEQAGAPSSPPGSRDCRYVRLNFQSTTSLVMHSLFRAASTLGCPDPEHGLESMGGPLWKTAGCRGPHLSLPPAGAAVVAYPIPVYSLLKASTHVALFASSIAVHHSTRQKMWSRAFVKLACALAVKNRNYSAFALFQGFVKTSGCNLAKQLGQTFEWLKVVTAEHERSCVVEWSSSSYHKKHAGLDNIGLCFSWQKSCAVPGEPDPRQRESFSRAELSPTEEMTSGCIVLYLFGESPLNSLLRWRPRLPARHNKKIFFMVNHTKRFTKCNLRKEVLTIFSETSFRVEKLLVTDAKIPVNTAELQPSIAFQRTSALRYVLSYCSGRCIIPAACLDMRNAGHALVPTRMGEMKSYS